MVSSKRRKSFLKLNDSSQKFCYFLFVRGFRKIFFSLKRERKYCKTAELQSVVTAIVIIFCYVSLWKPAESLNIQIRMFRCFHRFQLSRWNAHLLTERSFIKVNSLNEENLSYNVDTSHVSVQRSSVTSTLYFLMLLPQILCLFVNLGGGLVILMVRG